MQSLSILLPAFNEAARLPRTFELLVEAKKNGIFSSMDLSEIWVIDDGSKDNTAELSKAAIALLPEIRVHRILPNQGKGNAIHEGLRASSTDWCLIADADSATPWDQFIKLKASCIQDDRMISHIAIGSRDLPESLRKQKQSFLRESLGRLFNFSVRLLTGLPFKDTQCGFKLIHKPSTLKFLPLLQVKRFAWDVEFLIFAKKVGMKTVEVPIDWEHQEGSRISPLKDGIEMFLQVVKMRIRIWRTRIPS